VRNSGFIPTPTGAPPAASSTTGRTTFVVVPGRTVLRTTTNVVRLLDERAAPRSASG